MEGRSFVNLSRKLQLNCEEPRPDTDLYKQSNAKEEIRM